MNPNAQPGGCAQTMRPGCEVLYNVGITTHFIVKAALIGIERISEGVQTVRLQAGDVLQVTNTDDVSGLVEAIYRGRTIIVSIEDLQARAERVEGEEK